MKVYLDSRMNRFTSGWVTGKQQAANFQYILFKEKEKNDAFRLYSGIFSGFPIVLCAAPVVCQ